MPQSREQARMRAQWYVGMWIGHAYIWGGDDWSGFDCSGLAVEVLQAVRIIPRSEDYTADGLWHKFFPQRIPDEEADGGCLVFWFTEDRATHVEVMIDDAYCIGASGGGKPRYTLAKLCSRFPLLLQLCKPTDTEGTNPFSWLLTKMLRLWEADLRNAYVKMNHVDYRGGERRMVDPFLTIPA